MLNHHSLLSNYSNARHLLEWVGAGSPVGQEEGESNSLEDAGKSTNGDGVKWSLLSGDLGDELEIVSICSSSCQNNLQMEQRKRRRSKNQGKRHPCMREFR